MKKLIFIISLGGILPLSAFATGSSTINISGGMIDAIWAQAQNLFDGIQPYTNMIVGVILALLVIGELVIMLRNPNK